ncbi:MAG: response regulator [Acidobacteria bacterium]|nr:response regulator [Acidobacteriota bacterium]
MTDSQKTRKGLEGLRIALVDDERLTLKLLSALLAREGAAVVTFNNADDLLEKHDLASFDVLLSDMHMPICDGHSLIREVRRRPVEQGGKIPAIALTAYAQHDVLARAIVEGFNDYMTKPVDPKELVTLIHKLLGTGS